MNDNKFSIKNTALYRFVRKSGQKIRKNIKKASFFRKLHKADPVLVFQMGKVASSSVFYSLTRQYVGPVGHAHHIGEDNWVSVMLYDWAKRGNSLKLISPVREPIGRNISGFFQTFEDCTGVNIKDSKFSQYELDRLFIEKIDHDLPLIWFDTMMKPYFNIDVYETTFPDTGYAFYKRDNISLLVFRIDIPDSKKEQAIREFLGLSDFHLEKSNVSSEKDYNSEYNNFKINARLPKEYLDKMRASKYFKHFYSDAEITRIISKWERTE